MIIVNWNSGKHLSECLESIKHASNESFHLENIIIVDNASTDDSMKGIEDPDMLIVIIRNKGNIGFSSACNQGSRLSKADYILFLNPDTKLYYDSLNIPISFMEKPENFNTGICGIQLIDINGNIIKSCSRFPKPSVFFSRIFGLDIIFPRIFPTNFMIEWDHNQTQKVDQVMGAFFLVRHSLFEKLNGFDTRFFVYYEEVDFSLRASKAGYITFFISEAKAYHKGGGSSLNDWGRSLFYMRRSRILYGFKHFKLLEALLLMMASLLIEPISQILYYLLVNGKVKGIIEPLKCHLLLWKDLPNWIKTSFQMVKENYR